MYGPVRFLKVLKYSVLFSFRRNADYVSSWKIKRCVRFCDVIDHISYSKFVNLVVVFALLVFGGTGKRKNIFHHQKASTGRLTVSILFHGPGSGPSKRIQKRFRLDGAPVVLF